MSKQIKRSFKAYMAWNIDKEELALDQKSKYGWQLIKGGCYHSVFQKDDSCSYIHKIDYNPDVLKSEAERERYVAFFESQDWEYINSTFNGWNYFKKKYDPTLPAGDYEIYSDQESYQNMMCRWMRLGRAMQFLEGILGASCLYYVIFEHQYADLIPALLAVVIIIWLQSGIRKMKDMCGI